MKTKLTLNVDDKIVARAKRASAKRKVSLSSVVEEYLENYSRSTLPKKHNDEKQSLLDRIRKYTTNMKPLSENYDYRKAVHEHLDEKYGK